MPKTTSHNPARRHLKIWKAMAEAYETYGSRVGDGQMWVAVYRDSVKDLLETGAVVEDTTHPQIREMVAIYPSAESYHHHILPLMMSDIVAGIVGVAHTFHRTISSFR